MLTISDLTLGYHRTPFFHMNNLQLSQEEECLITGHSGSGKTTLLYTIAGLIPPLTGTISIQGTSITSLSESRRDAFRGRHIGLIFQKLHLVRSLTVLDNLLLAFSMAGLPEKKDRAHALLARLHLEDKTFAFPETLSQGQAQRVAIARALLHQPLLILADEPTASLDDLHCETVIQLLKEGAEDTGASLIIATHDARVKKHFSRIVDLKGAPQ